jgi:hypothetical protein
LSVLPVGFGSAAAGGYQIERSLRFNSADTAYLNRTPGSAGNRRTWTWSAWVKRSQLAAQNGLFSAGTSFGINNDNLETISFPAGDTLEIASESSGITRYRLITTQVFRDPSSWYHVVVSIDTTQATSTNRIKLYINGVQVTAFGTSTYPAQDYDCWANSTNAHRIGSRTAIDFNGYMTEVNFIDGQALTPSSFGETDTNTGVWKPKAYSGTYGTNGFYLKFADNSGTTSTTLGKDSSGNGNNWTPNNFSVTAGVNNDSMVDTPTPYGTDTGVGGEVRGNYATLNPLDVNSGSAVYVSDGNLRSATGAATHQTMATVYVNTGNFYAEATISAVGSVTRIGVGQQNAKVAAGTGNYALYLQSGNKEINGTSTAYGATFTTNDVIGLAYNATSGTLECFKNNVSQGTITLSPQGSYTFFHYGDSTSSVYFNFGQRPFAYTAPSGFKALCTQNLPTPTIGATSTTQADNYFDIVLRNGFGTSGGSITSVQFQPDFIWEKRRTVANHQLVDSVRGVTKYLSSNLTDAEVTLTTYFTSFNSNGYTLGAGDYGTGDALVDWIWRAGGTGVTNTAGTITSTVSANTTSGFSIVTYTGTGANATVGHGLGVSPSMVIIKKRNSAGTAYNWWCWHSAFVTAGGNDFIVLNLTSAKGSGGPVNSWNDTVPSSTVISLGSYVQNNNSGDTFVAYCFAAVAGYSAFGSYTGNGSSDGPFIFTNFRPKYVMVKRTDSTGWWHIWDTARNTYNLSNLVLFPNGSDAESTYTAPDPVIDMLSNGFKHRGNYSHVNASGGTYIYMALAENPFKYSLAR